MTLFAKPVSSAAVSSQKIVALLRGMSDSLTYEQGASFSYFAMENAVESVRMHECLPMSSQLTPVFDPETSFIYFTHLAGIVWDCRAEVCGETVVLQWLDKDSYDKAYFAIAAFLRKGE